MAHNLGLTKRATNFDEYAIDFADAVGVRHDDQALTHEDDPARGKQQLATLGQDFLGRLLMVVHAESPGDVIRLISTRRASPGDRRQYGAR